MAKFKTTIEFSGNNKKDYDTLGRAMAGATANGTKTFSVSRSRRVINAAEYIIEGNGSLVELSLFVSKVAAKVNKQFSYSIIKSRVGLDF